MSRGSILSDELVRDLVATGHVDVLVGLPTLDNARTVGRVVDAVHQAFSTTLLRERTVLINLDQGSTDDTVDIVRRSSVDDGDTLLSAQGLRTIHRISRPYHGLPGKGGALRTLLAAADLIGARCVALLDADVTSTEPAWVERLSRPVLEGRADYVAPIFARHPLDGPLVSQLLRPLVRSAYGYRLGEPLSSEFACSGRFATHCLGEAVWDAPLSRFGLDLWLSLTGLARGFACIQTFLGPRVQAANPRRPAFPEIFQQVAGALLDCLDWHSAFWLARRGSEEVPIVGAVGAPAGDGTRLDPGPMREAFRLAVPDLVPIFEKFLSDTTIAWVRGATELRGELDFPDELWVKAVHEAVIADRRQTLHREYLLQALFPLYLGRASAFLERGEGKPPEVVAEEVEGLAEQFEASKPRLVEAWSTRDVR